MKPDTSVVDITTDLYNNIADMTTELLKGYRFIKI